MTNHIVFLLQFEYYHLDSFTSLLPKWRQKAQESRDEQILDAISATVADFLWGEGDIGQHPGCEIKLLPATEVRVTYMEEYTIQSHICVSQLDHHWFR